MRVRRKLSGDIFMKIDAYTLLNRTICSVSPRRRSSAKRLSLWRYRNQGLGDIRKGVSNVSHA